MMLLRSVVVAVLIVHPTTDRCTQESTDCDGSMLTRTTTDTASDETTGRGTEQVANVDVTKQPVLS